MKTLKDILEVTKKTDEILVLRVKDIPESKLILIENGFRGDETLFRLKCDHSSYYGKKSYTPFFGKSLNPRETFNWGGLSVTWASEDFIYQRNVIVKIAREIGFKI